MDEARGPEKGVAFMTSCRDRWLKTLYGVHLTWHLMLFYLGGCGHLWLKYVYALNIWYSLLTIVWYGTKQPKMHPVLMIFVGNACFYKINLTYQSSLAPYTVHTKMSYMYVCVFCT